MHWRVQLLCLLATVTNKCLLSATPGCCSGSRVPSRSLHHLRLRLSDGNHDAATQAQERDVRSKAAEAAKLQRIAETDPETLEEEEVQKQRAWDDWVDDHPAGYGNSKLRPCAL